MQAHSTRVKIQGSSFQRLEHKLSRSRIRCQVAPPITRPSTASAPLVTAAEVWRITDPLTLALHVVLTQWSMQPGVSNLKTVRGAKAAPGCRCFHHIVLWCMAGSFNTAIAAWMLCSSQNSKLPLPDGSTGLPLIGETIQYQQQGVLR